MIQRVQIKKEQPDLAKIQSVIPAKQSVIPVLFCHSLEAIWHYREAICHSREGGNPSQPIAYWKNTYIHTAFPMGSIHDEKQLKSVDRNMSNATR